MRSSKPTSSFQDSKGTNKTILPLSFFLGEDVVQIARDLLGKVLVSKSGNVTTSGIICETEAYSGVNDRASHAYGSRRTNRNRVMYQKGGISYVYLCYGIHYLFNVVCSETYSANAVLIRNIQAIEGIEMMMKRRGKKDEKKLLTGPGTLCQALNIGIEHNGQSLQGPVLWIEDRGFKVSQERIVSTPRVGVDYAGKDAFLPYRFLCNF